jgi:hypothetical protein
MRSVIGEPTLPKPRPLHGSLHLSLHWLLATQHRWLLIATVSCFFVETISRIYFGASPSQQLKRSN